MLRLLRGYADPWRAPDLGVSPAAAEEMTREAMRAVGSMMAPKAPIPRVAYFIRTEGLLPVLGRLLHTVRRRLGRRLAGT